MTTRTDHVDWFEQLMGFAEDGYVRVRERMSAVDGRLRSQVNGRSYAIGELETPTLAELRRRAQARRRDVAGRLQVSCMAGDIRGIHRDAANEGALFQVASQFNLLEMVGPRVTPEDGVARYAGDRTQGPACAIAAGAATIYRNYFAEVDGATGQTKDRQIDCLRDVGAAFGNAGGSLWAMRNGYAMCTADGLATIGARLDAATPAQRDEWRDLLRIGLHWDVEVTDAAPPYVTVSQALCSALPVGYSSVPADAWKPFATLILEGTYEATLWAAVANAQRGRSNVVFLTRVGGGAFGNESAWIDHALRRALDNVVDVDLDVRLVDYGTISAASSRLAARYR